MNRDSLKQFGEKVDLYTVLKRRKKSVKDFLKENNIDNIVTLKRIIKENFFDSDLSKIFLLEATEYFDSLVPINQKEDLENVSQDIEVHKPGKRKKS